MVYDNDFYTSRRTVRPALATYTHTPQTRHYVVVDHPGVGETRQFTSYATAASLARSTEPLGDLYTSAYSTARPYYNHPHTPSTSSYTSTTESRTSTSSGSGPGSYSYSSERTSRSSDGPGHYSHSSVTTGRLPHGTTYRHYSYR